MYHVKYNVLTNKYDVLDSSEELIESFDLYMDAFLLSTKHNIQLLLGDNK